MHYRIKVRYGEVWELVAKFDHDQREDAIAFYNACPVPRMLLCAGAPKGVAHKQYSDNGFTLDPARFSH
jgi:hypothetical protein